MGSRRYHACHLCLDTQLILTAEGEMSLFEWFLFCLVGGLAVWLFQLIDDEEGR